MEFGYARKYESESQYDDQLDWLESFQLAEIYEDFNNISLLSHRDCAFDDLLEELRVGDTLFLYNLDVLSKDFSACLKILSLPELRDVLICIYGFGEMTGADWHGILNWTGKKVRQSVSLLTQVKKEALQDSLRYRFFAKNPQDRNIYREVLRRLLDKQTLKEISKRTGVTIETAFRIRKNFNTIKVAILIVLIFFLTFFSLKLVEHITENIFLQLLAVMIFTPLVIFFTVKNENQK